jgi:hypothetical protein
MSNALSSALRRCRIPSDTRPAWHARAYPHRRRTTTNRGCCRCRQTPTRRPRAICRDGRPRGSEPRLRAGPSYDRHRQARRRYACRRRRSDHDERSRRPAVSADRQTISIQSLVSGTIQSRNGKYGRSICVGIFAHGHTRVLMEALVN